jgi:hypothetical protein
MALRIRQSRLRDDSDENFVKKLITEAKELMIVAHSIHAAIVAGKREDGILTSDAAQAANTSNNQALTNFLAKAPKTSKQAAHYYLKARQEVVEAGKFCKSQYPAIYSRVVSSVGVDPFH